MQFKNVYKNKKILITGLSGFKGTWLAFWLNLLGAKVTGISFDKKNFKSHFNQKTIINKRLNIQDFSKLEQYLTKIQPEIIFHLAAQPLVIDSYEDPIETWKTNLLGTANLLEVCKRLRKIKAIVIVTSDKCYKDNSSKSKYKENDELGGHDPYSSSKAATELLVESYKLSFFNTNKSPKVATVRAGNVIGGGDWGKNRIIPDIMRSNYEKKDLIIRNLYSVRPWQHVLDCLSGYLLLCQNLILNKHLEINSWNFGPSIKNKSSVINLLEYFQKHLPKLKYKRDMKYKLKKESKYLMLNSSLANKKMKWKPILTFSETLYFTKKWYSEYYSSNNLIYHKQLKDYFHMALKRKAIWIKKDV